MLKTVGSYMKALPTVVRKFAVLHKHGVFLDEATPAQLNTSLRAWRVVKRDQGYLRSLSEGQCVDGQGHPIPWYTYPATEQLAKWDFSACDVLEYGSGNSTLWWGARARTVTAVENSQEWYEQVRPRLAENVTLLLREVDMEHPDPAQVERYVEAVDGLGEFDVIVVDGVNLEGVRQACAMRALGHLRPGGLFIVDNADWLPETCRKMRAEGFIEMDFCGLGPLNGHAETTSLFVKGDLRIPPAADTHPGFSVGGLRLDRDGAG